MHKQSRWTLSDALAEGRIRRCERDQWWVEFTDAAADLVEAGLAKWAELPGQPGCGTTLTMFNPDGSMVTKRRSGSKYFEPGTRKIFRRRLKSGDLFTLRLTVSKAEQERRRNARDAEYEAELAERAEERSRIAREQSIENERRAVANWPDNTEAFAQKKAGSIMRILRVLIESEVGQSAGFEGGYSFEPGLVGRLKPFVDGIEGVLKAGKVRFSANERSARLVQLGLEEPAAPAPDRGNVIQFARRGSNDTTQVMCHE